MTGLLQQIESAKAAGAKVVTVDSRIESARILSRAASYD